MKTFKKWLIGGCIWYTVISLLLLGIQKLMPDISSGINADAFLLIFPFGLTVSLGNLLYHCKKIPRYLRWISHYLCVLLAAILFLWLPSNTATSPATVLILLVAGTALYWLIFGLVHLFRNRILKVLEED